MNKDPQQWANELENALLNRSTPIVYAVSTNWWNDFQTWLMLLKEGFQLQQDENDSFLGHSNKPDNSLLIKEGDYNERTNLHLQMKNLQKDNIKIIHDYFMIDPQRFHINSDYSLISSEAYLMITKLTGGGPHIRLFVQDSSKGDQQDHNKDNIITSNMEGTECIGQGKIISLNALQLGVILIFNETATIEVGYYPIKLTLQEILASFQKPWILHSDITVDLKHCKDTTQKDLETTEINQDNSIPLQYLLMKSLEELNIESGSIIIFTINSVQGEDGCQSIDKTAEEFGDRSVRLNLDAKKKYQRRRGNRSPPQLNSWYDDYGEGILIDDIEFENPLEQNQLKLILEQVSNSQGNKCVPQKDLRNNTNEPQEEIHKVQKKKSIHSDIDSPKQMGKNNSVNEDDGNTEKITTVQLNELNFKEKQDSNDSNNKSQENPPLRGNRRGNILLRKKPDNSNASTEENGESLPDSEDFDYDECHDNNNRDNSRNQLSSPTIGAFIGLISVEEIAEIRMKVDQCQSGQLKLQNLPQKTIIVNLEDMIEQFEVKINELKQLKVKAEMNTSNSKNDDNSGRILRKENSQRQDGQEQQRDEGDNDDNNDDSEGDRKEGDYSERTSSTSTQPDTGKSSKNKKPKRNVLGMNQNLQETYLLDQSNMTDAEEQAS